MSKVLSLRAREREGLFLMSEVLSLSARKCLCGREMERERESERARESVCDRAMERERERKSETDKGGLRALRALWRQIQGYLAHKKRPPRPRTSVRPQAQPYYGVLG